MGSRNHEARDSESPKAPEAGGPSRDSATRGRSAEPAAPKQAATVPAADETLAARAGASETTDEAQTLGHDGACGNRSGGRDGHAETFSLSA